MSLAQERENFQLELPSILENPVEVKEGEKLDCALAHLFPKTGRQHLLHFVPGKKAPLQMRVGVVLSGGQAPGGHNVIVGLKDALSSGSQLFGFLGGPSGILEQRYCELKNIEKYRNSGGFDMIGSGRTKIETKEQLAAAMDCALTLKLDGLVIIGGDDSNTNAAHLAEYFLAHGCPTRVVGVPKTIDGDLKNQWVETSFGFDTASKVYSELIGNLCRDALSAKKYYHFVRLMGRSASHMTLECALKTHANFTIIGEEVKQQQLTLGQITRAIVDMIEKRAAMGKNYGVILIPEGLIEFLPKMDDLPPAIQQQLNIEKDPHGNLQVAHIETEKLLIALVKEAYSGKLHTVAHYFGYEGRCSFPSNFDANYCYALGFVAEALIANGRTGYMCALQNLRGAVSQWRPSAVPIASLLHMEERKGKEVPVIAKALVDLEGAPYQAYLQERNRWGVEDDYRYPGPIQLWGPLANITTETLHLEAASLSKAHQA